MRIAFATSRQEGLNSDDALAVPALAKRGIEVSPLIWDRDDPSRFQLVVIRSCWDYHLKAEAFAAWLRGLRVPVLNPPELALWNLNKRYLLDLERSGASIPETRWLPKGGPVPELPPKELVVKPAVSLNGFDTARFAAGDPAALRAAESILRDRDLLIQEYLPEIEAGELSFLFFDGRFSHAVRKTPRKGEFRVHVEHGGRREPVRPAAALIGQAEALLALAGEAPLYARVDAVERAGRLVLMELELIDPMLFLACDAGAPERFAEALRARLASQK